MYVRVISFQAQPGRLEEMVTFFQECILPAGGQQAGFEGLFFMTDEQTGKATSFSLWRSEEEMEAFDTDCLAQLASDFAPFLLAVPTVEVHTLRLRTGARPARPVLHFAETSLGIRVPNPGDEKAASSSAGTVTG